MTRIHTLSIIGVWAIGSSPDPNHRRSVTEMDVAHYSARKRGTPEGAVYVGGGVSGIIVYYLEI
uniref:Uncharacterized protein n=1 Tax=Candidatus Kentrum sp. LPFa TaxID=2126335 RepID=A0A450WTK1_9GAMM|nr:MAG: hypothetical protein BECKLPF1236A_GA0070988_102595 [Candidatus Kentron sp. LPFa]VFK34212.1 MAG: hypothetical protein BECKLPF1236C_GA0070990_102525 [Candidatus Kentron sp. LPFa]